MTNVRLEVLKLKVQGLKPAEIADKLNLKMAEVFRHDAEIKRQMAKENVTDMATLDPLALEAVTSVVNQIMPYMEKSTSKMLKASRGLKPLHEDMVHNSELVQLVVQKALIAELESDKPKLLTIERLSSILNDSYKAFFNKDGIQVVNVLNDMTPNEERDKTADIIKGLKEEREAMIDKKNAIDVEEIK